MHSELKSKTDIAARTFAFAQQIVRLCSSVDRPKCNRTLLTQLLRAATSVGANVEEAQAGQSRPDFLSKMSIACKEAREAHYWLRLLTTTDLLPDPRATDLLHESNQLVAILTSIVKRTRTNRTNSE